MNNMKKIIVSVIAILLLICMGCTVFASEADSELDKFLDELHKDENAKVDENEEVEQIPEGTIEKEDEETTADDKADDKTDDKTENLPETTPHAGLEDYTGLILVAVFAVSAIYAYKKVKEYNA